MRQPVGWGCFELDFASQGSRQILEPEAGADKLKGVGGNQKGQGYSCLTISLLGAKVATSGAHVNELACHRIVAGASVESLAGFIDLLSLLVGVSGMPAGKDLEILKHERKCIGR